MASKDDKPDGCIVYDPATKTAHFESAYDAWHFHYQHLGWRVTAESDRAERPVEYDQLDGGLFCDPVRRWAIFSEFRSAWLFLQLHPNWRVAYQQIQYEDIETPEYLMSLDDILEFMEELKEAREAQNA